MADCTQIMRGMMVLVMVAMLAAPSPSVVANDIFTCCHAPGHQEDEIECPIIAWSNEGGLAGALLVGSWTSPNQTCNPDVELCLLTCQPNSTLSCVTIHYESGHCCYFLTNELWTAYTSSSGAVNAAAMEAIQASILSSPSMAKKVAQASLTAATLSHAIAQA